MSEPIPVALFAYARPAHLGRVLASLKENAVPLIYAFADGAKGATDAGMVAQTRALLRGIDWCEVRLIERAENLGLGRNVLAGISDVASRHESFVVWEDDLVCVPGTYAWLCAALRHYQPDSRVMSVTAWTHPRVTPPGLGAAPYFDARAECWVWGAWARSWRGMTEESAVTKLTAAARRGVAPDAYGADLPEMAASEETRNTWAVRWIFHHLEHGGLCLRPPWSMVEHIGFDATATNAQGATEWKNAPLAAAPPIPNLWPEPQAHPACGPLWGSAFPPATAAGRVRRILRAIARTILPVGWQDVIKRRFFNIRWEGDYASWAEAKAKASGYDAPAIVGKVREALLEVKAGRARFERDGVAFLQAAPVWPAQDWIVRWARERSGVLRVLDFGGSLGSLYFQGRTAWDVLPRVEWRVVEQPNFVATGRQEFADGRLDFFETMEQAEAAGPADVLLLSGVLQYLENPHRMLDHLLAKRFPVVVLDRTPLIARGRDRLTVQHVPASINQASYPCWHFDRTGLLDHFAHHYVIQQDYLGADGVLAGATYTGFVFKHVDQPEGGNAIKP